MHPDRCTLSRFGAGCVGKTSIDRFKNFPIGIIDIEVSGKCMKNWPKTFLRCDVIKAGNLFIAQWNPAQGERCRIGHIDSFSVGDVGIVDASPGNPGSIWTASEEISQGRYNSISTFLIDPDSFAIAGN